MFPEPLEQNKTSFSPVRVLVTGASGQLGREVCDMLASDNEIHITEVSHSELDITAGEQVKSFLTENHFDFIVNCAAFTAVDNAEDTPDCCYAANFDGIINIARSVRDTTVRIIHISTDYVFDGEKNSPYTETDKPGPETVYGASKLKGESGLLSLRPDSVILRTGWLYSANGRNFVKTILRNALAGNKLKVVSDQTGCPTWAHDLADVIHRIIKRSDFPGGIYNYSNQGSATWYDFAREIVKIKRLDASVSPCATEEYPVKAKRPRFSVLDTSKIKNTLGIEIPDWRDSLKRCLQNIDLLSL